MLLYVNHIYNISIKVKNTLSTRTRMRRNRQIHIISKGQRDEVGCHWENHSDIGFLFLCVTVESACMCVCVSLCVHTYMCCYPCIWKAEIDVRALG